jgi:acetyl esterase/lipase
MATWARTLRVAIATALMTLAVPAALVATAEPAAATACDSTESGVPWVVCAWVGNDTTAAGTVVLERVRYASTSGNVDGTVCRPQVSGTYPIIVIAHGGFGAADDLSPVSCKEFAHLGYIAIAPDYRSFDTAPDVLCDGEVDDVLAMLAVVKHHPHADDDRVVMRGTSHGACIALRAYQRGVPGLVAAAAIAPPTDMDGEWNWLATQLNPLNSNNWCGLPQSIPPLFNKSVHCGDWQIVQDKLQAAIGGGPGSYPTEYADRSVDSDLPGLHDPDVPLLIVQGDDDVIVPPALTCATVAGVNALAGTPDFAAYHFTSAGTALTATAPASCTGFTWNTASNPTSTGYPLDHYFFAYAGYDHGHNVTTGIEGTIYGHVKQFLIAKT